MILFGLYEIVTTLGEPIPLMIELVIFDISLSLAQGILKCFNSDTINLAIVYFNIPSKNHKNGINHPHLIST